MKILVVILIILFSNLRVVIAQNSCADYSFTSTSSALSYSEPADSTCKLLCNPSQTNAWTEYDCTGFIEIDFFSPQTSYTLYFGSVNYDDYATITIDGGGIMSITDPINCDINDSIVGPFNCAGSFGDVAFTVNSTQPFQNLYIENTGCSSGWVLFCPDEATPKAGPDTTVVLCDESLLYLEDYIPPVLNGGAWIDLSSTGALDSSLNLVNLYNVSPGLYEFLYDVNWCGTTDQAILTLSYGIDSSCIADTVQQDSVITIPITENNVNAFSPNGDGINDILWIKGLDGSKNNKVSIFNRWGDRIAYIENYNNTDMYWDGYSNGKAVSYGTYYYLIEYEDGVSQKGWLQLVK